MSYDITTFSVNEVIIYLRKSRSDDPALTVEEVLFKHETQLQEYALNIISSVRLCPVKPLQPAQLCNR